MVDFSKLNLATALQQEEEEDELDRLMATHAASQNPVQAKAPQQPEPIADTGDVLADLLADDDAPTQQTSKAVSKTVNPPTERKKPRHVGTSRARATEKDARLLAFLGKFRVGTAETCSQLQIADAGPRTKGGQLTSVKTISNRLEKLERLGLVEAARMGSYPLFYGPTAEGVAVARAYGYLLGDDEPDGKGVSGIAALNVPHRLATSQVAAQFMSPAGYFKRHLSLDPLSLDQLISERTIQRYRDTVQTDLDADKAAEVGDGSFAKWRQSFALRESSNLATSGKAPWSEVMEFYPALWSLGWPGTANAPAKENHDPDLVVNLEAQRKDATPVSLFIEVEISLKPKADLERILRTYAYEFSKGVAYKQVIYFVGSEKADQIKRAIERADKVHGFGLIEAKRLRFMPLTGRDGRSTLNWVKARSQAR